MKSKGLLIALIISLGVNLGAVGTFAYYSITKNNPKLMWKNWKKKEDKTWADVGEKLAISTQLTDSLRSQFHAGYEETKSMYPKSKPHRDTLLELMKQPQLDTVRLRELLAREQELQSEINYTLYTNLYKTSLLLPPKKREEFIEFFRFSVSFYGSPWLIMVKPKGDHRDHRKIPNDK